jgi:hypothetical protein
MNGTVEQSRGGMNRIGHVWVEGTANPDSQDIVALGDLIAAGYDNFWSNDVSGFVLNVPKEEHAFLLSPWGRVHSLHIHNKLTFLTGQNLRDMNEEADEVFWGLDDDQKSVFWKHANKFDQAPVLNDQSVFSCCTQVVNGPSASSTGLGPGFVQMPATKSSTKKVQRNPASKRVQPAREDFVLSDTDTMRLGGLRERKSSSKKKFHASTFAAWRAASKKYGLEWHGDSFELEHESIDGERHGTLFVCPATGRVKCAFKQENESAQTLENLGDD